MSTINSMMNSGMNRVSSPVNINNGLNTLFWTLGDLSVAPILWDSVWGMAVMNGFRARGVQAVGGRWYGGRDGARDDRSDTRWRTKSYWRLVALWGGARVSWNDSNRVTDRNGRGQGNLAYGSTRGGPVPELSGERMVPIRCSRWRMTEPRVR